MSSKTNTDIVLDILKNLELLKSIRDDAKAFDTFISKELLIKAAKSSFLEIGFDCSQLSEEIKSTFPDVPWKMVIGLRNRIAHDYHKLNYPEMWRIMVEETDPFDSQMSEILQFEQNKSKFTLLDGKKLSEEILAEIAEEVNSIKLNGGKIPHLAAILVGNDGASETYVASKVRNCEKVGFNSTLIRFDATITQAELLSQIEELNQADDIDGFIVQLPLPKHIDENAVTLAIKPSKDVDGFHPENIGRMTLGLPTFLPATPNGVMEMLKRYDIETEGKNCVVLGRSNIVGTPMAVLMSRASKPGNATVTICHSKTKDLKFITQDADILIVAIGKPEFITAQMVKPGAVVIDVGIHRIADESKKSGFKLVGDVKFDEVAPMSSFITPVPGGVGLMTICSLLQNTLKSAKLK